MNRYLSAMIVCPISFIFPLMEATACSGFNDYVLPTNFELVEMTDVIVVATAMGETKENYDSKVLFRVDKAIKGKPPKQVVAATAHLGEPTPSDPDDLASIHPEAFHGACNRITFKKDAQYVLFLNRVKSSVHQEDWTQSSPFTRVNEDYFGEDSLWIQTIRYYVEVQKKYKPMAQLNALKWKYTDLMARSKGLTLHERKLAFDIAYHLMFPSPRKPTEYLLNSYEALEKNGEMPFAVRVPLAEASSSNKGEAQAGALSDLIFRGRHEPGADIEPMKLFILWSLVIGNHPDAMPLFEKLAESANLRPGVIGATARFYKKHGRYRDAIALVNAHAFPIMSNAPYDDVEEFLQGVTSMNYPRSEKEHLSWREDRHAKQWWPEFAMAIGSTMMRRFGADEYPDDVAEFLRPDDYRRRPDVALELANSFDEKVIAWAEKEVDKLLSTGAEAKESELSLPIGILLASYMERNETETPSKIDDLICRSDTARFQIIKNLGEHYDLYTLYLARRLAAYDLNDREKEALIRSLAMFLAEREKRVIFNTLGSNWDDPYELIVALVKGDSINLETSSLKPITCK